MQADNAKIAGNCDRRGEAAWPRKHLHGSHQVLIAAPFYKNMARAMGYEDETNSLELLVDAALSCWHKKLRSL